MYMLWIHDDSCPISFTAGNAGILMPSETVFTGPSAEELVGVAKVRGSKEADPDSALSRSPRNSAVILSSFEHGVKQGMFLKLGMAKSYAFHFAAFISFNYAQENRRCSVVYSSNITIA